MDEALAFLRALAEDRPVAAIAFFVLLRAAAIVIFPIQGFVVDVAGIALFGWWRAFLYAEAGIMAGATIAFAIARRSRTFVMRWLERLSSILPAWGQRALGALTSWERRLEGRQALWSFFLLRLGTNPAFDIISYAAGLTRMDLPTFFVATLLGNVPSVIVVFYFAGQAIETGATATIVYGLVAVVVWLLWARIMQRIE